MIARITSWTSTLLLLVALPATALAEGRLTLLSGESRRDVELVSLSEKQVAYRTADGETARVPADDLVSFTFGSRKALPLARTPATVSVHLAGGDIVRGILVPSGPERVGVNSAVLGRLSFVVDDVTEIRFIEAWEASEEKPVYTEDDGERDVFVYDNLDRLVGTFLELTGSQVLVHRGMGDRYPISFENLMAIRMALAPPVRATNERRQVLLLNDGSRVTARSLTVRSGTLKAVTIRGTEIECELTDVRAIYQRGGKFVYLSDLEPAETKIVPWMGEVYEWDRPRFDVSFVDLPLSAGGEAYQKGIGVLSGTSLTYELSGDYTTFTSRISLDDAAGPEGDVVFEVLIDGELAYRSDTQERLPAGAEPLRIPPLDISAAKTITLRVVYVDDFVMDYANWIEPVLLR